MSDNRRRAKQKQAEARAQAQAKAINTTVTPTLHLNGSGFDRLLAVNREAKVALRTALDKLAQAAPNGRDYYVQGDDAFARAQTQHEDRTERVRSAMLEIDAIIASPDALLDLEDAGLASCDYVDGRWVWTRLDARKKEAVRDEAQAFALPSRPAAGERDGGPEIDLVSRPREEPSCS